MQGSQRGIDCHSCHAQAASTQLAVLPETGARTGGRVLQALASLEGNWSEEATAAGARWVPCCAACGDSLVSRGTAHWSTALPCVLPTLAALGMLLHSRRGPRRCHKRVLRGPAARPRGALPQCTGMHRARLCDYHAFMKGPR